MSEHIRTPNPPLVHRSIPVGFAAFLDLAGKKCLGIKQFTKPGASKSAAPVIVKPTREEIDAELAARGIAQPGA